MTTTLEMEPRREGCAAHKKYFLNMNESTLKTFMLTIHIKIKKYRSCLWLRHHSAFKSVCFYHIGLYLSNPIIPVILNSVYVYVFQIERWHYRAKDMITMATSRDNVLVRAVEYLLCDSLEHGQQEHRLPSPPRVPFTTCILLCLGKASLKWTVFDISVKTNTHYHKRDS